LLILDEQPARRLATSLELRVIGTVGILMAGKERGFLAKIRPELDRLLAVRFFMDQDLYDRAHRPGWGVILKILPTGGKAPGDPRSAALCRNRRFTGLIRLLDGRAVLASNRPGGSVSLQNAVDKALSANPVFRPQRHLTTTWRYNSVEGSSRERWNYYEGKPSAKLDVGSRGTICIRNQMIDSGIPGEYGLK
jgi:hypothetical protein